MEYVYTVFAFIFGLVFGSFFNVVGLRIPAKESIVNPPSHCTSCGNRLNALDLIPVFSYIFLRGKCRNCGEKISPIYMIMELLTGLLFVLAYWKIGFDVELFVALLFISLLVIISVSDIAYMLIPDKVLLFFLPFLIIGRVLSTLDPWWDSILGAVVGFGILYIIAIISKGGMGGGDIKLFFLIGLVLGTMNTLLTLFIASLIGMVVGILIIIKRGQGRKTPVKFGPFIAIGALSAYFYGDLIFDWYIGLF